jgi:hypothetical protein
LINPLITSHRAIAASADLVHILVIEKGDPPKAPNSSNFRNSPRTGGPVEEIRLGDVVSIAPEEKHWHGASPTVAMTHIAIQEALNGKVVEWMEKVSDDDYEGKTRSS